MGSAIKLLVSLLAWALACAATLAAGYFILGQHRLEMFMFWTGAMPMVGPLMGLAIAVPVALCVVAVGILAARATYSLLDRWWPTPALGFFGVIGVVASFVGLVMAVFYVRHAADESAFAKLCTAANTTFRRAPSKPVTSIAHDWDPRWHRDPFAFTNTTTFATPWHPSTYGDDIEFVEFRRRQFGTAGSPGFDRVSRGQYKPAAVDAITADVVVRYEASDYDELQKAPSEQGVVRYSLSVLDRRDGQLLATMTYLLERKTFRACSANNNPHVDETEFVRRAIRPS